jgi:ribonuclease BN (tRNA processing enzyme)
MTSPLTHYPLQVLPLGTGDAFSSTDYYTTLLLRGGNTLCQVDCPDPYHKILRERSGALGTPITGGQVDHLLLTHLHADHCSGLESLLLYRKYISKSAPLTIYTLPEVARALWSEKLAVSLGHNETPGCRMEEYLRIQEIHPGEPFTMGDLRFEIRRTLHSVPCFGFRVSLNAPNSRMFAYSGDTQFDPEHIAFLAQADVIFHECGESVVHSSPAKLAALELGVRSKIRVLHLADNYDQEKSLLPVVEAGRLLTI